MSSGAVSGTEETQEPACEHQLFVDRFRIAVPHHSMGVRVLEGADRAGKQVVHPFPFRNRKVHIGQRPPGRIECDRMSFTPISVLIPESAFTVSSTMTKACRTAVS